MFAGTELNARNDRHERLVKNIFMVMTVLLALPVIVILSVLVFRGSPIISFEFLFSEPTNGMTAGGIWPALVGSIYLVSLTALLAIPLGVGAAIYLEEYPPRNRISMAVSSIIEVNIANLAAVPSVIYGLLGLGVFVRFAGMGESLLAGSCTLALLVLPVVIMASREALRTVPNSLREASWVDACFRLFVTLAEVLAHAHGEGVLHRDIKPSNIMLTADGRVMLFASSLDRAWNDLPVLPVFVPLIAGVTAYLSGELSVQTEAQLGTTLSPRAVGLAGGQIFDPNGDAALGIAAAGSGNEVLLSEIGSYEVLGGGLTELVAVNMDPNESDLTPMEPNAVQRWLDLNAGTVESGAAADLELAPAEPTPLWPWVLSLLIVVVFVESWVGNWHLRVRRGIAA